MTEKSNQVPRLLTCAAFQISNSTYIHSTFHRIILTSIFQRCMNCTIDFNNRTKRQGSFYCLDLQSFKSSLIVIDCSKHNYSIKSGPVDVRLEIEASANIVANRTAYYFILHDSHLVDNPLSETVKNFGDFYLTINLLQTKAIRSVGRSNFLSQFITYNHELFQ